MAVFQIPNIFTHRSVIIVISARVCVVITRTRVSLSPFLPLPSLFSFVAGACLRVSFVVICPLFEFAP
jgi:hypothetical protein